MLSFLARLTSFVFFLLSLNFLACALPTSAPSNFKELAARDEGGETVLKMITSLHTTLNADIKVLTECSTVAQVKAQVDVIVGHVIVVAKAVEDLGAHKYASAEIKAKIAAEAFACISLMVQACLNLSVKFGLVVLLAIFVKLDVCTHLLLVNLGSCIDGITEIVAKLVVGTCAEALVKLHFTLCTNVLVVVGI
ncbi:hypothetical protein RhiJN_12215 [Ceratobasidium sp. AG-Ba]|nr:hypothetical protein RhiJN_12215 [Ceratobasidium sp. AG-Ba]QRW12829.1 hypothetical protein RhiLY_11828 [Ceratobasidium sp. AG-Ba]